MEPRWLTRRMVVAIHDEALALFGGLAGIRDEGLLASALDRPKNRYFYEPEASLFDLAATLCLGIVKNHPFMDGNKRTALLASRAFLFLNGYRFEPQEMEQVEIMVAVAEGSVDEQRLSRWFKDFSQPMTRCATSPAVQGGEG